MKIRVFLFIAFRAALLAAEPQPDAGGITLEPSSGELVAGTEISISFPRPMVPAAAIDRADQPCPFLAEPKLDGKFLWKSETEGLFVVNEVVAGATHRLHLAPNLADASGRPFLAPNWNAEFSTPRFNLSTDFEQSAHLSSKPRLSVSSNYEVVLTEVAEHAFFQDRETRQRYPTEIIFEGDEKTPSVATDFTVTPREALPVGRAFDLVIDGLRDAKSRQLLPFTQVLPAGKTVPLKVEWAGAFNHALEEPQIVIKFNDDIAPSAATAAHIQVEPALKDQKLLASGDQIDVRGQFDLAQKYRVTISPALVGERGFALPEQSRWGATFARKESVLVFPSAQFFVRANQELRFDFFQVNTPALNWKLARIPLEKLAAVSSRVREFERDAKDPITGEAIKDPRTGFNKPWPTELLVDAFALPLTGSGNFEANMEDKMVRREIRVRPPTSDADFSGAYLLEASASLPDGRIVGNRSIICVSDFLLTQKRTPTSIFLRVAKMADGQPAANVPVRAVTRTNIELGRAVTDANGLAQFPRSALLPKGEGQVHLFIAETKHGRALQFADVSEFPSGSDFVPKKIDTHAEIVTDRNLYRPGQAVKFKGMLRTIGEHHELARPEASEARWRVTESYGDRVVAEGAAPLSPEGGFEAEWKIPDRSKLGRYEIRCRAGEKDFAGTSAINIEEYRVPLFSVEVKAINEIGFTARAEIASEYFHGAPNTGARVHWKATWTAPAEATNDDKRRYNNVSGVGPAIDPDNELLKTIEGDTQLDARGRATLTCDSLFRENAAVGRANILWRVDLTSAEAQTITGGANASLFPDHARLGVHASEVLGQPAKVKVEVDAVDENDQPLKDVETRVDLFHLTTKTVKEQIAPFVYRYHNTDQFEKVASQNLRTPGGAELPANATGRYIAAVSATSARTPLVSDSTVISGEEPAELPVENETSFKIEHREQPFSPGETAVLSVEAPFAGTAWVSVETDEIIDTLLVPLAGNSGRIELPIKKEYAPNSNVAIYLVKPGGANALPRERFAFTALEVTRPDRELKIATQLEAAKVKPGETVRGRVSVTAASQAVANADLAIFAVDDGVLTLGEWKLPNLVAGFYPPNPFSVRTYQALSNFVEDITKLSLTQKGFIIGGGGEMDLNAARAVRKEFRTLAFWNGSAHTDANGVASFEFVAPDNLTSYRVVAVGQTAANQFGGDASKTVAVSKPLLIQPALPRFLRDGDTVELRAVARENVTDSMPVTVRCVTDANVKLSAREPATQTLQRDTPAVFRFAAKVSDPDLAAAKILFEVASVADATVNDRVETMLPVQPPTIERTESVAGNFNGPGFDAHTLMPEIWRRGRGNFSTTISTSTWLPKIAGLPEILDYPHGCFEQISTRLLGYSLLANLLAYLPEAETRAVEYRGVLEKGMRQFQDSLLDDGQLPYWPGDKTGHPFVTAQACWALLETEKAGIKTPEGLREKLAAGLRKIVSAQNKTAPLTKCFAIFVLAQAAPTDDLPAIAQELYLRRNQAGDEGRAFLALALAQLKIMPRETAQLMRELDAPIKERAFDPATFTSATRAEAIRAVALETVSPAAANSPRLQAMRANVLKVMESSAALSTQENLWTLLAVRSFIDADNSAGLRAAETPPAISKNKKSAAWPDRKMMDPLLLRGLNQSALTFLVTAHYSLPETETARVDRGFRVERVVRNLTKPERNGSAEAPLKLGDQLLITYRVTTAKRQNYVALEDALPASFEVINPNISAIGKFFALPPPDEHDRLLELSYSELRDRTALLYFNDFDPSTGTYSILARATTAGTFRWPATKVTPMYDNRFSGLSASSLCVVSSD